MQQATPAQHPPVVLRSRYTLVRALLGIATIAIVALAVAVVLVAGDGNEASGTSADQPVPSIEYGGFNPATGRPDSAPPPQQEQPLETGRRQGGAPDEGLRGPGFSTD